jgi:hypothetical protein
MYTKIENLVYGASERDEFSTNFSIVSFSTAACNVISPTINFRIKIPVKSLRPIGLPATFSGRGPRSLSRGLPPL